MGIKHVIRMKNTLLYLIVRVEQHYQDQTAYSQGQQKDPFYSHDKKIYIDGRKEERKETDL